MATATEFRNDPDSITSRYVVLVSEHIGNLQPTPAAGNREALDDADFQLHFTLGTVATTRTLVVADIYPNARAGSVPVYFLPWQQNAATELTIPAGAAGPDLFMTSMLSGCTVQVHGTAQNPTITHANSRQSYENAYNQEKGVLEAAGLLAPDQIHSQAETRGDTACTAAINNMLPAVPHGVQSGIVRKADYAGRVNQGHMDQAKQRYFATLDYGERFTKFEAATSGQFKPKTGAFIYGKRDHLNNWAFFYQAAVELEVQVAGMFGWGGSHNHLNESAVLGLPTQFFP